jgi:hypothetical protein
MSFMIKLAEVTLGPNSGLPDSTLDQAVVARLITIALMGGAIISVFYIVLGALRYTVSGGDPAGIKSAKNTIVYAVLGLIVTSAATAVVNFVIFRAR